MFIIYGEACPPQPHRHNGGNMTKSLKQIQKENRKFILSALGTVEDSPLNDLFYNKPLTLSRVLLALKDKLIGYYDSGLGYIVYKKRLFSHDWYYEVTYICYWDLTKETLEEQSEKTQRGINKILTRE